VEVDMKDLLACCLTVREKEVDPFAPEPACSQCARQSLCYTKHVSANIFIQVGQSRSMFDRYHEEVTRIKRLDVHESNTALVLKHDA
jgi:hypothetical protein